MKYIGCRTKSHTEEATNWYRLKGKNPLGRVSLGLLQKGVLNMMGGKW